MNIELGPFKLIRPIGKGGMGVVWHGVHSGTGVPVAVKVITQRVSRDERTLKAFRNEVRAVAALDHPGVVWVVDYGSVSAEASIRSGRQLTEGSPYLVMEVATGGTLTAYKTGLPWAELKSMLMSLLDALAHAHARGVIHRDLKPGNVLICSPTDLRPGLKLTDFGIAHAREETVSDSMSNHVIGTLHYMAPEQIRADWRDYGPWTDLYSLGTIAYRLTTGVLPFKGKRGASLMVAQLNHRPPPLQPLYPVAVGFEDWLLTMLRKEHGRRFQCAADAALALASLRDPVGTPMAVAELRPETLALVEEPITALVLEDEPQTLEILDDGGEVTSRLSTPLLLDEASPELARRRGELDRLRPSIPPSWRRPKANEEGGITLRGAGLGLYGIRALSLIGREVERDAIWQTFKEVTRTRKVRVVVAHGPQGSGKTAMVKWLVERAVEMGVAHLMRCDYGAGDQPQEGIRNMMRKYFKVVRLDGDQRRQRVIEVCDLFGETDEADAARVERLLDPIDPMATDGGERHAALRWMLSKIAGDRPLILWFDDAHNGMDGLQFVLSLLRNPDARILVVLTLADERLEQRRLERSFVERILKSGVSVDLPLHPLSEEQIATHVRENLGLEASLALKVAKRSSGLPQFATQVVGEWVGREVLERGPEGYVLVEGTQMPSTLGQVWEDRVRHVLEGLPEDAGRMLELAAVLGDSVNDSEWSTVCDDADGRLRAAGGAPIDPVRVRWRSIIVDRLLASALAEERDDGWAFLAVELRKTLVDRAESFGRKKSHHAAIAAMLSEQDASAERRGVHLVAAGDLDAGIDALLKGVRERLAAVGPRPALVLLDRASEVLDQASVAETDPRRGRIWCTQGDLAIQRGRLNEATIWARKVLAVSDRGWDEVRGRAHFSEGHVSLIRKEEDAGREAIRLFQAVVSPGNLLVRRAAAHHILSLFAESSGDASTARLEASRTSEALAEAKVSLREVWKLLGVRGLVSSRAGTLLVNLERRRSAYETKGQLDGVAECWMILAAGSRRGKRVALAERCLAHAARLFERTRSPSAHRARLQLALIRAAGGHYERAEEDAVKVANQVRDAHRKPVLLKAHALLAVCAAGRDRWALLGDHLKVIERLVVDTGVAERDVAWSLVRAGDLSRKAGNKSSAAACYKLATAQYQKLGEEGQVRRLHTLLNR